MLDANKSNELKKILSDGFHNKIKKASVSMAVNAEKGDYKVIVSPKNIDHFYRNEKVASVKVSEMSDDDIEVVNSNPNEAAHEILENFIASYKPSESVKTASNKQAAHETQDEKTWDMVTQKQLDDQKPSLHPRKDEHYTNTTQRQLPEHGQRPGTYDVTTEAQFRDERKTFYGADRISGDWKQEDRNIVTERQLDDVNKHTEIGASDRGDMGSKFNGDLDKQHKMTGEKQIMELLRHHKWTEPLTTTEGKDQLGKQDGELSRITAEVAEKIIKEALNAMGRTSLATGATPKEMVEIISRLVSDKSKYIPLANVINSYAEKDISVINKKVAKAQSFGKSANTSQDWSEFIPADALIRQLGKIAYSSKFVVDGLVALSSRKDLAEKIAQSVETIMQQNDAEVKDENTTLDVFAQVLDSNGAPEIFNTGDDGTYSYTGNINDIKANVENQEIFAEAAAKFAKQEILTHYKTANSDIDLQPQSIDVNKKLNAFEVIFRDVNKNESLEARAERRKNLAKEASSAEKQAQVGGAGAAPPPTGAGADMGNPAVPPGGGDMAGGTPPGESLSQDPMAQEDPANAGPTGEAKPPGSFCPACSSEDVGVDNGEFRCNSCGSEGNIHVSLDITKWTGTIKEEETESKEGFGLGDESPGLGAEDAGMASNPGGDASGGTTLPSVPVAASIKLNPRILEKLAAQKINIGSICPNCGSKNTDMSKSASSKGNDGICWDCLQEFNVQFKASKSRRNKVYAQFVWKPKVAEATCEGCNRLRETFDKSLSDYGMSRAEFDRMNVKDRADMILKLSNTGWLNIDQAMESNPLPYYKIAASPRWKGYDKFDKFPMASCMERVARRFGENATSMSGPCQGKNLADCVCGQLNELGIYTDGLAAKVAKIQSDPDPKIHDPFGECVNIMVKDHSFKFADACTVCNGFRAGVAPAEELMIEAIAQINPNMGMNRPKPMSMPSKMPPKPMGMPGNSSPAMPGAKPMEGMSQHLSPAPMPAPAPKPMMGGGGMPGGMGGMSGGGMPGAAPQNMQSGGMQPGAMPPKPMDDSGSAMMHDTTEGPGDSSFGEMGGMGDAMNGGMGGPMDVDLGLGDDMVTIQLPHDAMHALTALMQALQGSIGNDMIDTTGDDILDTSGFDETIEDNEEEGNSEDESSESSGNPFSDSESTEDDDDDTSDIPGVVDSEGGDDDFTKSSDPSEGPSREDSNDGTEEDPSDMAMASTKNTTTEKVASSLDSMLFSMKRGSFKTQQGAIDSVFEGLLRQAKGEVAPYEKTAAKESSEDVKKVKSAKGSDGKITVTPAQDTKGIGEYSNGGKMGHEEPFSKNINKKPDVPRGKALMGDEDNSITISESGDLPTVPHGSGNLQGEKHYKAEKGNVVDGNQNSQTTASNKSVTKTANKNCKCGKAGCSCKCNSKSCMKPCMANSNKPTKTAGKNMTKTAKTWSLAPDHKYYQAFMKTAQSNKPEIQLADGNYYNLLVDQNKNVIVTPIKQAQQVTPKKIDNLEDDPDLNNSSGPGAGKTHADKAHSLAIDEKKPSEGVSEPDVPEAPNGGRLTREHTVDNNMDGPTIPAGGGMNKEYDQNENNTPEKMDQLLGNQNHGASLASREEVMKVAGLMLKANMITADDLPEQVRKLSSISAAMLDDYKKLVGRNLAETNKGMQRSASTNASESAFLLKTSNDGSQGQSDIKSQLQSMFRLDKQNQDHLRLEKEKGQNQRLYR